MNNFFLLVVIITLIAPVLLYKMVSWEAFKKYFSLLILLQVIIFVVGISYRDVVNIRYFWFPIDIKTNIYLDYQFTLINLLMVTVSSLSFYFACIFENKEKENMLPYLLSCFFSIIAFGANDLFVYMAAFIATTAINTKQFIKVDSGKSFLNYVIEFAINLVIALTITHAVKITGSSHFQDLYTNIEFIESYRYILLGIMLFKVLKFSVYKLTDVPSSNEFWLRSVLFPLYVMNYALKSGLYHDILSAQTLQVISVLIILVLVYYILVRRIQYRISAMGLVTFLFIFYVNLINKNEQTFKFSLFLLLAYQVLVEVFMKKLVTENYYILRMGIIKPSSDVYIIRTVVACIVGTVSVLMGLNGELQKILGFEGQKLYSTIILMLGLFYILISIKPSVDIDYQNEKESPFDNPVYNKIYLMLLSLLFAITFLFREMDNIFTFRLFEIDKIKIDNILVSLVFISLIFCFILWSRKNKYIEGASNIQLFNYGKNIDNLLKILMGPLKMAANSIHWIDASLTAVSKTIQYAFHNTSFLIKRYERYELTYSLFLMSVVVLTIVLVGFYK